ncbi:MAG: peptide ABC transporter substrate-binding protein [Clostridia bacterium]|nr:peptide ABC transporter substrate-binding protein [Clostridia bacterium]
MKRFLSLILALSMVLLCTACSEKGAGKNITYALDASPETLDPQFASSKDAHIVINNIFEGLVRLSNSGEVIGGIAESWEVSADGLLYTFRLKEGTEWYCPSSLKNEFGEDFYNRFSAEKVTANDFVFAMRRAINPQTGSPSAHRLFVIENAPEIYSGKLGTDSLGVYAQDNNTLVVQLETPCDDFLERLTESVFMPCNEDFFNATGGRYGLTHKRILCNGPFYVSAWDSETSLTVKNNKYYAGKNEVLPMSVIFSFDSDTESVAKKLSAGTISAALLPPDYSVPENCTVVNENENGIFGFFFNCADGVLKNTSVRQALCASLNRELFSESENMKPQSGFIPVNCTAGSVGYREAAQGRTPVIEYSEAKAGSLWKKGLSELEKTKVQITVLCPEGLDGAVRQQLQIWQRVMGISLGISVENKTAEEIEKAVAKGEYQIALTGLESDYDSAVDFLASLSDGGVFRFNTEEYSRIIERLLEVDSDDDLIGGCYTAETYILQQGICLPLYSRSSRFVTAEEVDGISLLNSETGISFIGAKRFD